MKFVLFYHSFVSCWNHGNAHFLRGVCRELVRLGHEVVVYEPQDGWSRANALRHRRGSAALAQARKLVPGVALRSYLFEQLDLDAALDHADVVIAHEWNTTAVIAALSKRRLGGAGFRLFFHDTHHRAVSAPDEIDAFDLAGFDGVLAFGAVLRDIYARRGWGNRAFTWHEAADTALFCPQPATAHEDDVIFIGNWGDGERAKELQTFLFDPARTQGLKLKIYGVRYPIELCKALETHGVSYGGWLPNHEAPRAFARAKLTIHVPRAPYVALMPGIPTIRVFEALACGVPLISSPWDDIEGLFPAGSYALVKSGQQMSAELFVLLRDTARRGELANTGLTAVRARHTCAHRVAELLSILNTVNQGSPRAEVPGKATLEGAI
jgi:spore maturation protein CgeB